MTKARRISAGGDGAAAGEVLADQTADDDRDTFKTPRTHEQADKIAAALGLVWPDDGLTVAQKVEHLSEYADLA